MNQIIYRILSLIYLIPYILHPFLLIGGEINSGEKLSGHFASSHLPYQELIYIHTDRRVYLTGENVKFKVYCLERLTSRPSQLSKVAYVELYNNDNSTLLQSRIELIDGTGSGEIYIPTSANTGNFIIRGYTRWMQNEGPDSFFHALLTVINPFKNPDLKPVPTNKMVSLDLYAEGGSLIDNVPARVVFHRKQPDSCETRFSGRLLADDSILISEFKPIKNGLGSFEFNPNAQRNYVVELLLSDGTLSRQPLPPIKLKGISLRLIDQGTKYRVQIFCNDSSSIIPFENLNCITFQKGIIINEEPFKLTDDLIQYEMEKKLFDEGIFTIQLINSKGEILISRKGFKYTKSLEEPRILMDKDVFENRDLVQLNIPSLTAINDTGEFDLSVSVSACQDPFREKYTSLAHYVLLDNSMNLFDNLELYLQGSTLDVSESIDNLLIAYHKKDDVWSIPEAEEKINFLPEIRGPLATGKIYNKITKEPGAGIMGYISVPGKWNRFYVSSSENDGHILFELVNFYGKHEIVVQCNNIKDSLYTIELNDPYSPEYLDISIPELSLNEKIKGWLERQSQNMQIENAYKKFRPEMPIISSIDSSAFYGEPDARYYLDDYTRFPVMEEVMREYIYGVYVRKKDDRFHFRVNDPEFDIVYDDNPLILLDGLPIFDADEIMALDPLKMEKIETIIRAYGKGYLDCHGIVSYTSYHGDLAGYSPHKETTKLTYEGLQIQKQPSYPGYSTLSDKKSRIPDFRNSLYWSPTMKWGMKKTLNINFYTSDDVNNYEIRINGINKQGKSLSAIAVLQVK